MRRKVFIAKSMAFKAQIEQSNKVNDETVKEITDLKGKNGESCRNQNKTKEGVKEMKE